MKLFLPGLAPDHKEIPGLELIDNFIDHAVENQLIEIIDKQVWICELKRRVQHYGYRYDYKLNKVTPEQIGDIPDWLEIWCNYLLEKGIFETKPNQVIVNEYTPGLGIAAHTDASCFGDTVCSLSLASDIIMTLANEKSIDIFLQRRSLLVLKDQARYEWQHGIAGRKTDKCFGQTWTRKRRISITFRTVKASL